MSQVNAPVGESQVGEATGDEQAAVRSNAGMPRARTKYQPFDLIDLPNRQWPNRQMTEAPIWCSVDLRDGNQALAVPMSVEEKLDYFQMLVELGFKEIEVGFPSASQIEYDFMRRLIDENRIPDDVVIQVLVQAREALIRRTFESLQGAKQAIVHLYNSTNPLQREVVFNMSKEEIVEIAVKGTELVKSLVPTVPETKIRFQYSPESFSLTEMDFALEICEAVVDVWQPTPDDPMILNLPATVEIATPNVHADQIEWFCNSLRDRESIIISLHTHNDRGTGVAATELGMLAGADRVEGTLFGNGERTGNVDIVTLALNLYSQGVDPKLDFSDIESVREAYEKGTRMEVHPRHPYGGELVFTAFSGSHQDAIRKGMLARDEAKEAVQGSGEDILWAVPYLPIDPKDIGRNYEAIIRVNSQSGKGGVAYVLESEYGIHMPKAMHTEFGKVINQLADKLGVELSSEQIYQAFDKAYLSCESPLKLESFRTETTLGNDGESAVTCVSYISVDGEPHELLANGNGPIDAFVKGLQEELVPVFEIVDYRQHTMSQGSNASSIAYVQIKTPSEDTFFGSAKNTNIEVASVKAVLCAVNRAFASEIQR